MGQGHRVVWVAVCHDTSSTVSTLRVGDSTRSAHLAFGSTRQNFVLALGRGVGWRREGVNGITALAESIYGISFSGGRVVSGVMKL